jgi:phosphatidylserine decarboxylase
MSGGPYAQIVQELIDLLDLHNDNRKLDTAIKQALAYDIRDIAVLGIVDTPSFLKHANYLVTTWVPSEEKEGKDIYYDLVVFYFIFNQPGLKDLQNPISPTSYGQPLTYLSKWLVSYASAVGHNLDQESSLTPASLQSFRDSAPYKVDSDYIEPRGGWKTFNDFFARLTKPGLRPVASLCDSTVITSPADVSQSIHPQTRVLLTIHAVQIQRGSGWTKPDIVARLRYLHSYYQGHTMEHHRPSPRQPIRR